MPDPSEWARREAERWHYRHDNPIAVAAAIQCDGINFFPEGINYDAALDSCHCSRSFPFPT
jgi:hypothetical protein